MSENVMINREASDSIKGIRFQKLRLLRKMLQMITKDNNIYIVGFPEFWEDLYIMGEGNSEYMEQDKEYTSKFTINSEEIRKAFVSFIDLYITYKGDKGLKFIFHTNTDYTKENKSIMLTDLELKPLDKPVFDYLIIGNPPDFIVEFITKVIIYSYEEIYNKRDSNIEILKKMTIEQWRDFLNCITYEFGQPNLKDLNKLVLNDVTECCYFTADLVGKEEMIKDSLLEAIDEKMSEILPLKKAITSKEVELIYFKAKYGQPKNKFDPNYEEWYNILCEKDEINDIRNLKEKIYDVCKDYPIRYINKVNREATTVKCEMDRLNKKQLNSLKTRVFESMEKYFSSCYECKENYTAVELKDIIRDLKAYAIKDFEELKKDYDYGLKNKIVVEKLVMMLIDECFYCFEGEI